MWTAWVDLVEFVWRGDNWTKDMSGDGLKLDEGVGLFRRSPGELRGGAACKVHLVSGMRYRLNGRLS